MKTPFSAWLFAKTSEYRNFSLDNVNLTRYYRVMMTSSQHQAWLFYMPLAKQAALLKDDLLEPVDQLLEDAQLIELVRHCLGSRSPASTRTGRPGMAPDRLLRCCVLKHLKGWSFRQLARELRCNLIYRQLDRKSVV